MGRYNTTPTITFSDTQPTWPTSFPKETIGIERSGVIFENRIISSPEDLHPIPGSLEAIKSMRLKGYKVAIFFNEPLISQGLLEIKDVDIINQRMLDIFGNAGIQSIDTVLYSTTTMKEDVFAMPNTGMMKKAETESRLKFKGGYFVGDKISNLKAGFSSGAKPVLVSTGNYEDTLKKLSTFANRDLKKQVKVFSDLLEFSKFLP